MNENELYHHGIKGQKWGVRRFQTKSGKLTADGKKRYSNDSSQSKFKKSSKTKTTKSKKKTAAAKTVSALGKIGKFTVANVSRYAELDQAYKATDALLRGDVGQSLLSGYTAYNFRKVGRYLYD